MLIEMSVSNFRSFRETQTFSMIAASRIKSKKNATFVPEVDGEEVPALLKVAAIYGPNASGKSNLVSALSTIRDLVRLKPEDADKELPVSPFRFDPSLIDTPSCFEIHFIAEKKRYFFKVELTKSRIISEKLVVFPKGKETLLYERTFKYGIEMYDSGAALEGGTVLHNAWISLTGPKTLFLSQAVANSKEDLTQLKVPHFWLKESMDAIEHGKLKKWTNLLRHVGHENPDVSEDLARFLAAVDIPITKVRFEDQAGPTGLLGSSTRTSVRTTFTHQTNLGEADFDFDDESEGTKNLMGFWLPWYFISQGISKLYTLVVDELDSSLHPEIVASLIRKHLSSDVNTQLIFTTHDTHLMNTELLRRDQFWLTERDLNGATQIRSIHDFEGREGEDIEKRYFDGRYRSLPILRNN